MSAILMTCFQTEPATCGFTRSWIGSFLARVPAIHWKILLKSSGVLTFSFAAIGCLLSSELGSFARAIVPPYSG